MRLELCLCELCIQHIGRHSKTDASLFYAVSLKIFPRRLRCHFSVLQIRSSQFQMLRSFLNALSRLTGYRDQGTY